MVTALSSDGSDDNLMILKVWRGGGGDSDGGDSDHKGEESLCYGGRGRNGGHNAEDVGR